MDRSPLGCTFHTDAFYLDKAVKKKNTAGSTYGHQKRLEGKFTEVMVMEDSGKRNRSSEHREGLALGKEGTKEGGLVWKRLALQCRAEEGSRTGVAGQRSCMGQDRF